MGECFGYKPGTLVTGKMVSALRQLGFQAVFDTNFTADLTIIEEGNELLARLRAALVDQQPVALPMFTSCSPGWIKFMEYFHPEMLPNLSTCKSPQQMFGAVAKTYYANKLGKRPQDIFVVSVMPCTAKKFECERPEMRSSGVRDVDVVLTTRELGKMIRAAGIDFDRLPDGEMDSPAGAFQRRRRHLRQYRRRDGSRPAHGLRGRHRPGASGRQPARRAAGGPAAASRKPR